MHRSLAMLALAAMLLGGGEALASSAPAEDAFEPNDTRASAALVHAGADLRTLWCGGEDWYRIDVPERGKLTVSIAFAHRDGDVDLVLEGSSGPLVRSDGTTDLEECAAEGVAPGAYYAHVYGYQGARNAYGMKVTFTPTYTSGDDAFEPNDRAAEAIRIAPGMYGPLRCNDDDWYEVELPSRAGLTVEVAFRHTEGDLDLALEAPSGALLGRSQGTTDSERTALADLAAGSYRVRVYGYGGAQAPYNLTVSVHALPDPSGSAPGSPPGGGTTTGGGTTGGSTTGGTGAGGSSTAGGSTGAAGGGTSTSASLRWGTVIDPAGALVRRAPDAAAPAFARLRYGARVSFSDERNGFLRARIASPLIQLWVPRSAIALD